MIRPKACCCIICRKETTSNGLTQHILWAHTDSVRKEKASIKMQGKPAWNKGLTKADPRIQQMTDKAQATMLERNSGWRGYGGHSVEIRQLLADQKNALYASGWEPICGRCKKYDYDSPIAGKIKVDGTWELTVARHLDAIGVTWKRNKQRFSYVKPDGSKSTYQPDFYVEDWDTFIEVKGYQTALDDAKWEQFPCKLEVWKKDKIKTLEN